MLKHIGRYYHRNFRHVIGFAFVVALGVLACGVFASIFGSFADTQGKITGQTDNWIEVVLNDPIDEAEITNILEEQTEIQKTIEVDRLLLGYKMFGTATCSFKLYLTDYDEVYNLMSLAGVELTQGDSFTPSTNEIVVSEEFLRANNLHVGDCYREKGKYFSQGRYKITGSLKGDTLLAIGCEGFTGLAGKTRPDHAIIIYAEKSALAGLEEKLKQQLSSFGDSVYVYGPRSTDRARKQRYLEYYLITGLVLAFIALVTATGVAVLNAVQLQARRREYTLMHMLGRSRGWLYTRLVIETSGVALFGWLLGQVLSFMAIRVIQQSIFAPRGMFIFAHAVSYWASLLIPIFATAAGFLTVSKFIRKDTLGMLKGKLRSKEEGIRTWRWVPAKFLRYGLRTRAHRPIVIGLTLFVATIVFLGMLTSSVQTGKEQAYGVFDKVSVLTFRPGSLDEELLAQINELPEVEKVFLTHSFHVNQDVLIGAEDAFVFTMSADDVSLLAEYLGSREQFASESDILMSTVLARSNGWATGSTMGYGDKPYRVIADDGLTGSVGIAIRSYDRDFNSAILVPVEGQLYQVNEAVNAMIAENLNVSDFITREGTDRTIAAETEFVNALASILVYLQFFVVLIVMVYTVTRAVRNRRREIAIMRVMGLSRKEVLKEHVAATILYTVIATLLGTVLGYVLWKLASTVFFGNVVVLDSFTTSIILRVVTLPAILIVVSLVAVTMTSAGKDPVRTIQENVG